MSRKPHRRKRCAAIPGMAALAALLLSLLIPAGEPSEGRILWQADHETRDLGQWFSPSRGPDGRHGGGIYNSGIANVVAADDVQRNGHWAARLSIQTPGGVSSGVRLFRWAESHAHDTLRYRAWYYFPQPYRVKEWWNVFEWKSKTHSRNDAFFVVNVGNRRDGAMYLYLFDWQRRKSFQQAEVNVPVRQWFEIEAEYRCNAERGSVAVWQDKRLLFEVRDVPTRYRDGDCQWAVTNYSDGVRPDPAVIYVDDPAITLP